MNSIISMPDTQEELSLLHDEAVLKLAIMQMQDDETEQILMNMDEAKTDAAYARYKEKNGERVKRLISRRVHNIDSKQVLKRIAPRILQTAAAVIAILSLGLTTAIATVPAVRSKVLTLLMDVQERYTELRLIEKQGSVFFTPPDWDGEYFPSFIPQQFVFLKTEYLGSKKSAFFMDESNNLMEFSEIGESATMQIDTENAINEFTSINGSACLISTKSSHITVTWMHNDKYFYLFYAGNKSEAMKIAESLVHIR